MNEAFRQALERLLLDRHTPSGSDYLLLDQLPPAALEIARGIWSQASVRRRRKVLQVLVEMAEESVDVDFGTFFRLALSDPDAEVRRWAVEGLGEDEDTRLIAPLVDMLLRDPDENVRAAAAISLARFVFMGQVDYLCRDHLAALHSALLSVIRNPAETVEVRRRAIEALALADLEEVPEIIAAAYQDPNEQMRLSAVFAMGRTCDPDWTETVIAELAGSTPAMRFEAARAAGELEAEAALPALLQHLDDPDREVREMVIWALGEIGGKAARRALRRRLKDADPGIREAAEEALAELEFKESGKLLSPVNLGRLLPAEDS